MKLIIFLLLTVSAWGQIPDSGSGDITGKEPERIGVWGDSVTEVLSLQKLIWYWDTYKAECWADSEKSNPFGYYDDDTAHMKATENWTYWEWDGGKWTEIKSKWTHRSPDPFEFIDVFLRRRVK